VSDCWGSDRGTPIDRFYIEKFLFERRADIRGCVLEIKNSVYTDRFGTAVVEKDVLDLDAANTRATIIADLARADNVPDNTFDCFILTQTLQYIFDTRAALYHAHRMLKPGGVLLCTVPCVSRIDPVAGIAGDYWRFMPACCSALVGEIFDSKKVQVVSYGNVFTSMAFLTGMALEELTSAELSAVDPFFPMVVCVRAQRT
jgi:SAM-dependent methyltransferase